MARNMYSIRSAEHQRDLPHTVGAIRAASVGFIPLDPEARYDEDGRWVGFRFLGSQLIELSLVSVPANPDAVQLARSVDAHPAFLRRVFPDYHADVRASSAPAVSRVYPGFVK